MNKTFGLRRGDRLRLMRNIQPNQIWNFGHCYLFDFCDLLFYLFMTPVKWQLLKVLLLLKKIIVIWIHRPGLPIGPHNQCQSHRDLCRSDGKNKQHDCLAIKILPE